MQHSREVAPSAGGVGALGVDRRLASRASAARAMASTAAQLAERLHCGAGLAAETVPGSYVVNVCAPTVSSADV
jgi:hypothetical protein